MRQYIPVLTIAGSDSSGGAGIQADIKTISAIGCYGMSAITSITAQNTTGVRSVMAVEPSIVTDQIEMTVTDIPPMAIKTGMLCNAAVAEAVAAALEAMNAVGKLPPLVIDPVMVSTSGSKLLSDDAIRVITTRIFPLSTLVTPNCSEAVALTSATSHADQIAALRAMGCRNILLKGGDDGRTDVKADILALEGDDEYLTLVADAVDTRNTHGTGCTLSAAIASYLALGYDLPQAVEMGKLFITRALRAGAFVTTGRGHGPVNHFFLTTQTQKPMEVTVNNTKVTLVEGATLLDLLNVRQIKPAGIATAVNGNVVPAAGREAHVLADGDTVTIIRAFYGG